MTVLSPTPFPAAPIPERVSFDRRELARILAVYGRFVAAGEWRDYGFAALQDRAVFAIFRRTAENPAYRIEKIPALRNRQGQFAVIGEAGQVLRRGHDLDAVLRLFEGKSFRLVP